MSKMSRLADSLNPEIDRRRLLARFTMGAMGAFLPFGGASAQNLGLRGYLRTNWSNDPYAFGSYSYVARGARQSDSSVLGASINNRLFFAGEATHPRHNSTVHAAYESGITSAGDVLQTDAKRVAVIGAGISGLAAAHVLAGRGGLIVTMFEARSRIGGRIWTDRDLGIPLDLGASWIHGTRKNPISALARTVDAALVTTGEEYIIRGQGGRRINDHDAPDWLDNVVYIQHNAGADSSQLNMQAYMAQPEYAGDEVIFPDGYDTILDALSEDFTVRLSEPVSNVTHDSKGVVITANGKQFSFDAAVITLPLGVLKQRSVQFTPDLPEEKKRAIDRMGMGTLDKLYLRFDRPFWDERVTWIATPENGLPEGYFNQWFNLANYLDEPIIMAFNGGPPALELSVLPDDQLVEMALSTLKSAYPA